jgi:hypothetical protein
MERASFDAVHTLDAEVTFAELSAFGEEEVDCIKLLTPWR